MSSIIWQVEREARRVLIYYFGLYDILFLLYTLDR